LLHEEVLAIGALVLETGVAWAAPASKGTVALVKGDPGRRAIIVEAWRQMFPKKV
jgi:hypothetical protein